MIKVTGGKGRGGDVRLDGSWWRFTGYELRGEHIVPAVGAKLVEYDIFEDYRERSRGGHREDVSMPYEELVQVNIDGPQGILKWCNQYGLLGILPHRLVQVTEVREDKESDQRIRVQHVRGPSGWSSILATDPEMPREAMHVSFSPRLTGGGVASLGGWSSFWDRHELEEKPVSVAYKPFFPAGEPAGGYPLPLSREFWWLYAEPIWAITGVVQDLRRILNAYRQVDAGDEITSLGSARYWLQSNAVLRPSLARGESAGSYAPALVSESLISSLATMFWLDLAGGKDVRVCADDTCGRLFVTALYNRRYCSDTCKRRADKRAWRAGKRKGGGDSP